MRGWREKGEEEEEEEEEGGGGWEGLEDEGGFVSPARGGDFERRIFGDGGRGVNDLPSRSLGKRRLSRGEEELVGRETKQRTIELDAGGCISPIVADGD